MITVSPVVAFQPLSAFTEGKKYGSDKKCNIGICMLSLK